MSLKAAVCKLTAQLLAGFFQVALFVVIAGYAYGEGRVEDRGRNGSVLVSAAMLAQKLSERDVRILDARPAEEYKAGHIPGAIHLAIKEITRTVDGIPGMLAPVNVVEDALSLRGISRNDPVVIYDDFGGVEATRLFWALEYLGHARVRVLQGGFQTWRSRGRPISTQVPARKKTRYRPEPNPDLLADRAFVKSRLSDSSFVLVDARSLEEFSGKIPGRDVKRPGHIPGAINVDWVLNLAKEPRRIKDGPELARLYRGKGVTADKEIIVYCRTGVRASHAYFVLRLLGYPRVRLYDGSYVEWSAYPDLPIAP